MTMVMQVEQVPGYRWLVIVINIGAIAGLTSVILVSLMSQPRIFYAMAVDGFMPECAAKVGGQTDRHHRHHLIDSDTAALSHTAATHLSPSTTQALPRPPPRAVPRSTLALRPLT